MIDTTIIILLVEDNKDFARLTEIHLRRYEKEHFKIIWKENYQTALAEIEANPTIDVILMDYFLPGKNGLEITQDLRERKVRLPIVFLTVSKDFDIALNVMKLGVAEYLNKEDISSPVFPKTIMNVIERHKVEEQLIQKEVSRQRLIAMRDWMAGIVNGLEEPLTNMRSVAKELQISLNAENQQNYVKIINENVERIAEKLEKIKQLKEDKTVRYIKDIKMIDIS